MRNQIRRLATIVSFLPLGILLCTQPLCAVRGEGQFGARNGDVSQYDGADQTGKDYRCGCPVGLEVCPNIGYSAGRHQSAGTPKIDCLFGAVGGSLCFISSTQTAFNQDIMGALAFLGFVVVLWRLIIRLRVYASRRQPSAKGHGTASKAHGKRQKREEESDLGGQPTAAVIEQSMAQQVQRIWNAKNRGVEQDLHESL